MNFSSRVFNGDRSTRHSGLQNRSNFSDRSSGWRKRRCEIFMIFYKGILKGFDIQTFRSTPNLEILGYARNENIRAVKLVACVLMRPYHRVGAFSSTISAFRGPNIERGGVKSWDFPRCAPLTCQTPHFEFSLFEI